MTFTDHDIDTIRAIVRAIIAEDVDHQLAAETARVAELEDDRATTLEKHRQLVTNYNELVDELTCVRDLCRDAQREAHQLGLDKQEAERQLAISRAELGITRENLRLANEAMGKIAEHQTDDLRPDTLRTDDDVDTERVTRLSPNGRTFIERVNNEANTLADKIGDTLATEGQRIAGDIAASFARNVFNSYTERGTRNREDTLNNDETH